MNYDGFCGLSLYVANLGNRAVYNIRQSWLIETNSISRRDPTGSIKTGLEPSCTFTYITSVFHFNSYFMDYHYYSLFLLNKKHTNQTNLNKYATLTMNQGLAKETLLIKKFGYRNLRVTENYKKVDPTIFMDFPSLKIKTRIIIITSRIHTWRGMGADPGGEVVDRCWVVFDLAVYEVYKNTSWQLKTAYIIRVAMVTKDSYVSQ